MTELPTSNQQKLEENQQAKTKLHVCLKESGLDSVTAIAMGFEKEILSFIDENHALFKHACENKPDNSARQTLLGLLTKEHIEENVSQSFVRFANWRCIKDCGETPMEVNKMSKIVVVLSHFQDNFK